MTETRKRFIEQVAKIEEPKLLTVAVRLPNGALETINNTQNLKEKIQYYIAQYDDEFRLKAHSQIQIQAFILL
jgi:hypothetical protein